jgi:hypothetical protein
MARIKPAPSLQEFAYAKSQESKKALAQIATLERQLSDLREKLDWSLISPDNLPKQGDEVWAINRGIIEPSELTSSCKAVPTYAEWMKAGYTHFRPINAPAPPHTGAKYE